MDVGPAPGRGAAPIGSVRNGAAAARIPAPFLVLGLGGLVPFLACAAAAWYGPEPDRSYVLYWMVGYAMVILSFVGALHWGIVMMNPAAPPAEQWLATGWSVLPALVAWYALNLPTLLGLQVMAGMFLLALAMDRRIARQHPVPPWFFKLRIGLTVGVVASLLLAVLS